jgi:hypothetical protein
MTAAQAECPFAPHSSSSITAGYTLQAVQGAVFRRSTDGTGEGLEGGLAQKVRSMNPMGLLDALTEGSCPHGAHAKRCGLVCLLPRPNAQFAAELCYLPL